MPVGILLGLAIVIILVVFGAYTYKWEWTGFMGKTLWDWMKLLIVPIILGVGALIITQTDRRSAARGQALQQEAMQAGQENAYEQMRQTQEQIRLAQLGHETDRLQTYLDRIAQLLRDKDKPLHESRPGDEVRLLAQAWALTMLRSLHEHRQISDALQFLHAAALIERGQPIISLSGASLSGVQLQDVNLNRADLSGAHLDHADLSGADLSEALLNGTNLTDADLTETILSGADLTNAQGVTKEQLEAGKSLGGATMPDGQQYEDWLQDEEGSGKDVENE